LSWRLRLARKARLQAGPAQGGQRMDPAFWWWVRTCGPGNCQGGHTQSSAHGPCHGSEPRLSGV